MASPGAERDRHPMQAAAQIVPDAGFARIIEEMTIDRCRREADDRNNDPRGPPHVASFVSVRPHDLRKREPHCRLICRFAPPALRRRPSLIGAAASSRSDHDNPGNSWPSGTVPWLLLLS